MAYIDKDKVIQLLRTDVAKYYPTTFLNGILASAREIAIMSTEDVVPRSEVEELEKKLNDYKKFVGEIRVTDENHCVIIDTEYTEYIDKRVAEGFKNMAVKQAKQKIASAIIKFLINKKHELQKDKDLINASVEFYDFIDNFTGLTGEEILAELKKKYIGE